MAAITSYTQVYTFDSDNRKFWLDDSETPITRDEVVETFLENGFELQSSTSFGSFLENAGIIDTFIYIDPETPEEEELVKEKKERDRWYKPPNLRKILQEELRRKPNNEDQEGQSP